MDFKKSKGFHKNVRQCSAETSLSSKRKIKFIFVPSTLIEQLLYTLICFFITVLRIFECFQQQKKEFHEQINKLRNTVKNILQNTVSSGYDKVNEN